MILFGGGWGAVEILPFIDYENIRRNPKLFSSYSDATSILNAVYSQTGLVTYYGIAVGEFYDLRLYTYRQFQSHFLEGYGAKRFESDSEWKIIREGCGEGTLIGGYTSIFALMLTNEYFAYNKDKKYILFLEDHERFSGVGAVATYLAFISQSAFMRSVTALIFGHFSVNVPPDLLRVLQRFGERHNIPVVYTDDFGHGNRHAVLPIGVNAELNTSNDKAAFNFPQPPLSEKS